MLTSPKRVLVFSHYYPPAFLGGGPIRTLSALTLGTPEGFVPFVVTSDTDLGQQVSLPVQRNTWSDYSGKAVYYFSTGSIYHTLRAFVAARAKKPDLVYLSSFFNLRFSVFPQLLARFGFFGRVQVALAPRGEFSQGALGIKSKKKQVFIQLYRLAGLSHRTVWHASSDHEAADIRRSLGNSVQIIVRENDTDLPKHASAPEISNNLGLRAIFVGRIVPIKGLLTLLKALRNCQGEIQLDIYGPEEDPTYSALCRSEADRLPPNIAVKFHGALPNERMRQEFRSYDVMTLPTLGENFGHVIAEALAASCPVICADVTPWTQRLESGGGKLVAANTVEGWTAVLEEYSRLSKDELLQARKDAGDVYNRWRTSLPKKHIFQLLVQE